MAKTLSCREVGLDCDYVVRGETEEEVMRLGAEHGRQQHGMTDAQLNDPQTQQKVRSLIRDA
jgi:predicted small metal-binding protein